MNEPVKRQHQTPPAALVQVASFSGPIPPPDVLKRYEEVLPGAAERILKMAEEQSAHRRKLETTAINSMDFNSKLGIAAGLFIILACIALAAYCVHRGANLTGLAMVIGSVGGLLGAYLYGKKSTDQDLSAKRDSNKLEL